MRPRCTLAILLALGACGPRSRFHDYSTPERAAQCFVEAGRVGDLDAVRASVVTAERDQHLQCDYSDLGPYKLVRDRDLDRDHAVVVLQSGTVSSPLACVREADGWKVSIHGSLALLRQLLREQLAAAPR